MYWMIGGDGREYGPVSADQLGEWVAEHRANGQTQVRRDGETAWQPLAALPEFADALRDAAGHHAVPPPPPPPLPGEAAPVVGAGMPGQLEIGGCLGRAWSLLMANLGLIIGACLLFWGLRRLLGYLCIGVIVNPILLGPLMAGLSLIVLKRARQQPTHITEMFSFFGPPFVQFMLLGIIYVVATSLGMLLCFRPRLVLMVIWAFAFVAAADRPGHYWHAMETSRHAVMPRFISVAVLLLIALLPFVIATIYLQALSTSYAMDVFSNGGVFDFSLLMDQGRWKQFAIYTSGLEFKHAMVQMLNLPFALAVTVQAYEDLLGHPPGNRAG